MSDLAVDASLALQWFLEDESGRDYSLKILDSLATRRALVPSLWFYEIGNGLLVAHRRKRISIQQLQTFLVRLQSLPIDAAAEVPNDILRLPELALKYELTNYDAAYLALSLRYSLPLATNDRQLNKAAGLAGVAVVSP